MTSTCQKMIENEVVGRRKSKCGALRRKSRCLSRELHGQKIHGYTGIPVYPCTRVPVYPSAKITVPVIPGYEYTRDNRSIFFIVIISQIILYFTGNFEIEIGFLDNYITSIITS